MEILIILLLILLNGIFAMSEIAMVSARKARLETAARKGDKAARKALELAANPGKLLSTVQIGITLIGILTGIYSGEKIQDDLTAWFHRFTLLQPYSETIATTVIVVVLTFFSLVLGELVPKRIGLTMPERISKLFALPMYWISVATAPFIWLLTVTSDLVIKLLGIKPAAESRVTEEEIKAMIQEGTEGGAIDAIEQDIVERVFSLGDRKVASLKTHRSDTVFLDAEATMQQVRETVNREMHSVYPVYEDNYDNVVGIVLLKDLFRHINDEGFNLKDHIKAPQYILEGKSAYETLRHFKTSGVHYGIITDEYGHMQGLLTMNDLLEALVGDVSEFYHGEFSFVERSDGTWLVDGQFPLSEFLAKFDLQHLASEYAYNTISGLILDHLRHIPKPGEKLQWQNFELEIMDMDKARIDKILVKQLEQEKP